MKTRVNFGVRFLVVLTFLLMIVINVLANIIPINGVTTGEVSDYYANLFSPAAITFSIWGLIYLLLAGYTIYQLFCFRDRKKIELLNKIGLYFSISSLANAMWIFCWHYYKIPLSMLCMIVILICLIIIVSNIVKFQLTLKEWFFIQLPFSIYFGWITIAIIANMTTLLVYLHWDGFGISEVVWTMIAITLGTIIGIATMLFYKDMAYGFAVLWGFIGILIKQLSPNGFHGEYPAIIITTVAALTLLFIAELYLFFLKLNLKS
ncbi:MAG: tryptophan-rich sensory protein [Anaerovorax sp.]|nr:tryptophan-rich sensory protein [Anaerovorax sp.]